MVLIDDKSDLNVCPLKTASWLGLNIEDFVPTDQHVRAYDNSRMKVMGLVTLELTIGPMIKKVKFQVLNIALYFNMLIGRPWIHDTESIPSSLYQKVWFLHEGAIVTIYGNTLTTLKPVFGINSKKKPLTLDGFEIERPGFERRGGNGEDPDGLCFLQQQQCGSNDEENELPSKDELGENCEEADCPRPNDSYCHTTFWARL